MSFAKLYLMLNRITFQRKCATQHKFNSSNAAQFIKIFMQNQAAYGATKFTPNEY
jgi:hypothetical protein